MILVTGAAGKTGKAVVAALARSGEPTRALVRIPSQKSEMIELGATQAVAADMLQPAQVRRALEGIDRVYHIGPNAHPQEEQIGRAVVAAARASGAERLVLHSVLHPQARSMPHHLAKLRLEETLLRSGMDFVILQPTAYMQNLVAGWSLLVDHGLLRVPYPVATRLSLVDLDDVAEVAARAVGAPALSGGTYELAGTLPLSQAEIARILSTALRLTIRAEAEPVESWDARARAAGMEDARRSILIRMFRYYRLHGLVGNPAVLRSLLGREPTDLAEFARRVSRTGR